MKEQLQLYKLNNSEADIKKNIHALEIVLANLKNTVIAFNSDDISYLQGSYIEFCNDILDISMHFKNTKYFFLSKNFKTNIQTYYENSFLKDDILELENTFKLATKESDPQQSFDDTKRDMVWLFSLIENITRKYDKSSDNHEFKIKIIKFYNALHDLFLNFSDILLAKYYGIMLCNHPAILLALIKSSLKAASLNSVLKSFSSDSLIKECDDDKCTPLSDELLAELITIFAIPNPNFSCLIYSKTNAKTLNSTLSDFEKKSSEFIDKNEIFDGLSKPRKIIACELFLRYSNKTDVGNISKNILLIGPMGSGKLSIAKSMVAGNSCRVININSSYNYENLIDGFINGKFIDGELKLACKEALADRSNNHYIIINNINYADMNSILGEILELLDNRYDGTNDSVLIRSKNSYIIDTLDDPKANSVVFKDSKSYFAIPDNLYIIATYDLMLSLKSSDTALMAKFSIIPVECNYSAMQSALDGIKNAESYIKVCQNLNKTLSKISPNAKIGHMVFLKIKEQIKGGQISASDAVEFYNKELKFLLLSLFADFPRDEVGEILSQCAECFNV